MGHWISSLLKPFRHTHNAPSPSGLYPFATAIAIIAELSATQVSVAATSNPCQRISCKCPLTQATVTGGCTLLVREQHDEHVANDSRMAMDRNVIRLINPGRTSRLTGMSACSASSGSSDNVGPGFIRRMSSNPFDGPCFVSGRPNCDGYLLFSLGRSADRPSHNQARAISHSFERN
jgi:hypothetical protein